MYKAVVFIDTCLNLRLSCKGEQTLQNDFDLINFKNRQGESIRYSDTNLLYTNDLNKGGISWVNYTKVM